MGRVYSKLAWSAATAPLIFALLFSSAAVSTPKPAPRSTSFALSLPAPAAAKLTFRRIFKSSTPEFIEITIREDADQATYDIRQIDEDPEKLQFEVGAPLRAKMFELAGELNHFQGQDLDVHRKIANLGEKTFRWEQGT
ncbi:MAG TPA: hypothetical protein VN780_12925, partial [Candidatus Eisenbacteria bacterium]|nr:hypothetical protein [Candidatus Eisenbacteria bacterium]